MASESIAGLKVAKTSGAELRDSEIFAGHARARGEAYLRLLRSIARGKFVLEISSALVLAALLFVAVTWVGVRGSSLLVLIFVFVRVVPRVMALQQTAQLMMSGLPAFDSISGLITDCETHAERVERGASNRLHHRTEIRLRDVSYSYTPAGKQVLDRVSLAIPAGRVTAIVGPSGAGKSTLADILIGLLRPTSGTLSVDGTAVSEVDLGAWRRSIGYVPQDGFLLHDTIRVNLRWAVPDATESQMWDALDRAMASDFVRVRPEGLDAVVGDRGVRLSGGERQRLALARALLTRPQLLVLDEATSALDSVNEERILAAVEDLADSVTTVIITHRLSAIRNADVIHVLDGGELVESGTFSELTARGGTFHALLKSHGALPLVPAQSFAGAAETRSGA
jgi:ATP-binding cassette subfamily C protein